MEKFKIEEKDVGMIEIRTNEESSVHIATVWMNKNTGRASKFPRDIDSRKIAEIFKKALEEEYKSHE